MQVPQISTHWYPVDASNRHPDAALTVPEEITIQEFPLFLDLDIVGDKPAGPGFLYAYVPTRG